MMLNVVVIKVRAIMVNNNDRFEKEALSLVYVELELNLKTNSLLVVFLTPFLTIFLLC